MSTNRDVYRLVLLPVQYDADGLNPEPILGRLQAIGLLGEPMVQAANAFLVGERFFDHLSFLGCSPHINIEPQSPDDTNFCHIRVHNDEVARLYSGQNTGTPHCPECKSSLTGISKLLSAREAVLPEDGWQCEACGSSGKMKNLNWRKTAGFARVAIEVWSVHPHEAVPTSYLIGTLEDATGVRWRYIYC